MTRKLLLTLADDVTETSCGSCDYASLMPCAEPTIYICTRPEFETRDASGKYETAERPGRTRLPACIAAEQAEKERDALKLIASDLARRAVEANEEKRDSLLAENARLQGEIAQHIAFRAEVNDALPRPFGVTVIGAIKALRDELDARPAITEDDIDAIREGIYGDDRMSRKTLEAALAALSRVAHASQPKGDGGYDA